MAISSTSPALAVALRIPVQFLNGPEVPANGVLLFSRTAVDEIVVTDGSDAAVEGVFANLAVQTRVAYSTFRADEELELGAYTWVSTPLVASGAFTAVPAYQPAPHELDVTLSLGEIWVREGSFCCEPDPSTGDATCVPTDKVQRHSLKLTVRSPLPTAHAGQYLYRTSALPARDAAPAFDNLIRVNPSDLFTDMLNFTLGSSETLALAPASEYCIEFEAMSLIDDSVFTTRRCLADPGVELATLPLTDDEYRQYFHFDGCAPPATDPAAEGDPSSDLGDGGCACRLSVTRDPSWPNVLVLALALGTRSLRQRRRITWRCQAAARKASAATANTRSAIRRC